MFLEFPIISTLIISAISALVIWGFLFKLYVQPQQSKIAKLEKKTRILLEEVLKLQQREQKRAHLISERKKRLKAKQNTIEFEPVNPSDDRTPAVTLIRDDLQSLLDTWNDKNLTKLQRKTIEDSYIGQSVKWEVKVMSVSEEKDGKIWVTIVSSNQEIDSAHAVFDQSYKRKLLTIKSGEIVEISGTIERFFLSPVIVNCKLFTSEKPLAQVEA